MAFSYIIRLLGNSSTRDTGHLGAQSTYLPIVVGDLSGGSYPPTDKHHASTDKNHLSTEKHHASTPSDSTSYADGMRGVACTIVAFFHLLEQFFYAFIWSTRTVNTLGFWYFAMPVVRFFTCGHFSVLFFFVLSGFVLPLKFYRSMDPICVSETIFKRYIRLGIPVIAASYFSYWLMHHDYYERSFEWSRQLLHHKDIGYMAHISETFFTVWIKLRLPPLNPALWTIKHEFVDSIYVMTFAQATATVRHREYIFLVLAVLMVTVGMRSNEDFVHHSAFTSGLLLSYLHTHKDVWAWRYAVQRCRFGGTALYVSMFVFGMYLSAYPTDRVVPYIGMSIVDTFRTGHSKVYQLVGSVLILFSVMHHRPLQALFQGPLCRFLGKASFGMYLSHIPLIGSFSMWAHAMIKGRFDFYEDLNRQLTILVSMPFFVFVGYLFHIFFDKPAIKVANYSWKKFAQKAKPIKIEVE